LHSYPLHDSNNRLFSQYAYRLTEKIIVPKKSSDGEDATDTVIVLKHDNDDDGEDGAGSRLAHLLQMRHDDGVLVVVSRWFGGIHLGPKRFAHITSTAQVLLAQCAAAADGKTNNSK
jgi:Uncharacterized protein family UPF0029